MCVCVCVCVHLDAVLVAVRGASRAGALPLGEDDGVLVEEHVPHARPLPPGAAAHRQLAVPHQLAALRHRDLRITHTHTHTLECTYLGPRPSPRALICKRYHLNLYFKRPFSLEISFFFLPSS